MIERTQEETFLSILSFVEFVQPYFSCISLLAWTYSKQFLIIFIRFYRDQIEKLISKQYFFFIYLFIYLLMTSQHNKHRESKQWTSLFLLYKQD